MLLNEINTDWMRDNSFTYQVGLIEYHCKVKYLPFSSDNKEEYENKDLTCIYTPVFHFEFEALNTEGTIYKSHWIMPYSLIWWLENRPDSAMNEMVLFTAQENGFVERITEADRELQRGKQLSFF